MAEKQIPEGMVEKKIPTAKPLYAAAAAFLLAAAVLPVYSLWGLLLCAALAGLAYWGGRRLWGTRTVLVPAPGLAFATGEKALDQVLARAEADLKRLHQLKGRLEDPALAAAVARMESAGHAILVQVSKEPTKAKGIRKFAAYYLPTAVKVLSAYAELAASGASGENARALQQDVERNADTIARAFEAQLDALFAGQALDVSSDLDVLEAMAAGDGLTGGSIAAAQAGDGPTDGADEPLKPKLTL